MESDGWLAAISERLGGEGELRARLEGAIERYRSQRDERSVISDAGGPPGGGPDRVKCLHAHLAHQLADPPNAVGAIALTEAGWPDCRQPCFQVRKA
jgi:hypothetical protein